MTDTNAQTHAGTLYELDGIKGGPVALGPTTAEDLLQSTARAVQQFANDNNEHRINLMALALAQ
jgi:hypothetical protein